MTPQAISKVSAGQGQAVEAGEGAGPSWGGDNIRRPFSGNNARVRAARAAGPRINMRELSELEPWGQR